MFKSASIDRPNDRNQSFQRSTDTSSKLEIGHVGDQYEREADSTAERVVSAINSNSSTSLGRGGEPSTLQHMPPAKLQRKKGEEEARLQMKPEKAGPNINRKCNGCAGGEGGKEEEKGEAEGSSHLGIQRMADGSMQAASGTAAKIATAKGGGQPMEEGIKSKMEQGFGRDFSNVNIHTDSRAAQLNREVGARAFTTGNDIFFRPGAYDTESTEGQKLLAHELTHVTQQEGGSESIQRLALSLHNKEVGTCGARNVQWVFSLSAPAPEDGYIVQKIESTSQIATCPDTERTESVNAPFWEAWKIREGEKVDWTTTRDDWTDGSTRGPLPGKNGMQRSDGTIKFFKQSVTGDLGDFNQAPVDPASDWGPGKVRTSGALPSTPNEPDWWSSTPTEGPETRFAQSEWDCCGEDAATHTNVVTSNP